MMMGGPSLLYVWQVILSWNLRSLNGDLVSCRGDLHSPKFILRGIGIPSWIPNLGWNSKLNKDLRSCTHRGPRAHYDFLLTAKKLSRTAFLMPPWHMALNWNSKLNSWSVGRVCLLRHFPLTSTLHSLHIKVPQNINIQWPWYTQLLYAIVTKENVSSNFFICQKILLKWKPVIYKEWYSKKMLLVWGYKKYSSK